MVSFDKKVFFLRELLTTPPEFISNEVSIFIEDGVELASDSRCAVLTENDYDEAGDDLLTAIIAGIPMSDFLSVDALIQVVDNANLQRESVNRHASGGSRFLL